jgi:hypothetical protein
LYQARLSATRWALTLFQELKWILAFDAAKAISVDGIAEQPLQFFRQCPRERRRDREKALSTLRDVEARRIGWAAAPAASGIAGDASPERSGRGTLLALLP